MNATLSAFLKSQLDQWPEAAARFRSLESVLTKTVDVDGFRVKVQFNPARKVSTAAKVDAASIAARPCFLCEANRPQQQFALDAGDGLQLLLNPFPIFSQHFTLPTSDHTPQVLGGRIGQLLRLAAEYPGMAVFYNGAKCGASAPDHFHFQMVSAAELPIFSSDCGHPLYGIISIDATPDDCSAVDAVINRLPALPGEEEPRINVIATALTDGKIRVVIIPRRHHRPDFYGTGDGQILLSPASIDLAGVIITTRREDFDRTDANVLRSLYRQTCRSREFAEYYSTESPTRLKVGIVTGKEVTVDFGSEGYSLRGRHRFTVSHGSVLADGLPCAVTFLEPENRKACFTVIDAIIGIGFHWERREDQLFNGAIEIMPDNTGNVVIINHINIEEYLKSVISSEMKATASDALLRAHAVISRSWVKAQTVSRNQPCRPLQSAVVSKLVRWYDRENHTLFDVCADDHCQRYQGLGRRTSESVADAVDDTCGMVLTFGEKLCDARFSKCCGGIMERFSSCWADTDYPYLQPLRDTPDTATADVSAEADARKWIESEPEAFCNTTDRTILSQVLNAYDTEDLGFYRWETTLTGAEATRLFREKGGPDVGEIVNLTPVKRGPSGRITHLRVTGTGGTAEIGKELEIRRLLSPSHLKSSAFTIERSENAEGEITFRLHGAGWGHGVGLCQIGAAVMGARGYSYREILSHYYPGSELAFRP